MLIFNGLLVFLGQSTTETKWVWEGTGLISDLDSLSTLLFLCEEEKVNMQTWELVCLCVCQVCACVCVMRQIWSRSTRQEQQIHYICFNNFLWKMCSGLSSCRLCHCPHMMSLYGRGIIIQCTHVCVCVSACACVWSG